MNRTENRIWLTSTLPILLILPALCLAQDKNQLIRSKTGSGNLYEKLIVQSNSAFYVKEPTIASMRIPTPAFSIYYRLTTDTSNNEKDGYYRIGKRSGEPVGWIKKEFVTSWNTRFGLEPSLPQPDRYFTIFKDQNAKTAHIEFIGKEGQIPDGARRFALIVDVPEVESSNEIYPVVVFTGDVQSGGAKQNEQMALYNLQLEIVFVIDTTASMEPLIEVAREVVRKTAETLANLPDIKPVVHFGLVEYRDAPPQAEFAARTVCKLSAGHQRFYEALTSLSVSTKDTNDIPEDMVAGLQTAIVEVGWRPNSSKHIIVIGDAPAKDGYDTVLNEELRSATGRTLANVMTDARPVGGSDSERALGARNFHCVSNNHQPIIEQFLEGDNVKELSAEQRKAIRDLVLNPEIVQLVRKDAAATAQAMIETGMGKDGAIALVRLIQLNDSLDRWEKTLQSQLQKLASNQHQLEGFYARIDTYRSPQDRGRAIQGLTQTLNKAYQALAVAREGKATDSVDVFQQGGSISRAIYQIAGTKGDATGLNQVERGYATTRDENGRLVGQKRVMVFKEELMRLYSVLDSLHTTFKGKSNKAERQNVSDILDSLKRAVASQVAGQEIDENINLNQVIKFDFPLKTPALEVSAQQIAVMTTPAFNNWLESLATARDRAKTLVLGGKTNWTTLNNEDEDQFTFLALAELP